MKYIRKINGIIEEYALIKNMGKQWYKNNGYLEYYGNNPIEYIDIIDGNIVELDIPEAVKENKYTKNQIRTSCRELNIENKLNEILNLSTDFKIFWDECLEVDLNYPMTQQALKMAKFTDEDIKNIIDYIELHSVI